MLPILNPDFLFYLLLRFTTWVFSSVTVTTTMNPVFVENAFWISFTVNMSTLLFFVCRSCAGGVTRRYFERPDDFRRSLYNLHDEKKWYIPRLMVASSQSVLLFLLGLILLIQDNVVQKPFYGLNHISRICFAINIGCYIYRIVQDAILSRHLSKVSVDIVHHVVTVAVYTVFLIYQQNALFGTLGMLFAITTPCTEIRRLMKTADLGRYSKFYGINLAVCCILNVFVRLLLPCALIIWSLIQGSPLTMDVVVVAIYFLSAIFFGILNIWLVITATTSIYKFWHKQRTDKLQRVLDAGKPHGLEIRASDRHKFTTKRNDLNLLMPCSNANIAPQSDPPTNAQRCNIPSKSYHKANVSELLNNPTTTGMSYNQDNRRELGSHDSSSSDGFFPTSTQTNVNVQINDWERNSASWEDTSSRASFPLPTVSNLERSQESSSTTSDVETLYLTSSAQQSNNRPSGRRHSHGVDECDLSDVVSAGETEHLFSERNSPKRSTDREASAFSIGSPSTSILTRSEHVPLTRSLSGGALDMNFNNIYRMQMAIMREHDVDLHGSNCYDLSNYEHRDTEANSVRNQSPPSSQTSSDITSNDRARTYNSSK